MTLDLLGLHELIRVWEWIEANPKLHKCDDGPQTFAAFTQHLHTEGITLLAARTGKKLVGAIGVVIPKTQTDIVWIRGIHFVEHVRGTDIPWASFRSVLRMFNGMPVHLRFFADNPYMHGFLRKVRNYEYLDGGGSVMREGKPVELQLVEFENGSRLVTSDLRLPANQVHNHAS